MARPGITYHAVAEAANHLLGQGKNPTIEQVRLLLGTGSSTTIAGHLREWKSNQDETSSLAVKENLPTEFIALMKGLWQRLTDQADEKIQIVQQEAASMNHRLQSALDDLRQENSRWKEAYEELRAEKERLLQVNKALEQSIIEEQQAFIAIKTEQAGLIEQLNAKKAHIAELNRLHHLAQQNLDHFRESMREQRLLDQQQFELQKQELQSALQKQKEEVSFMQEKTISSQQQFQLLQQAYSILERNQNEAIAQIKKQTAQLIELEKISHENKLQSQRWHDQYQETQHTIENKNLELIEAQTDIKLLSQQLTSLKQMLSEVSQQTKSLEQEKWLLMQEKAQLKGQMNMLEKMTPIVQQFGDA